VYDDDELSALYLPQGSDFLLIIFRAPGRTPRLPLDKFLSRHGLSAIGLIPKRANYYPAGSVAALREEVAPVLARYASVIALGHSMGAYAVAKYGAMFGATCGLAFSVQYSINPAHFPGHRITEEYLFDPAKHVGMEVAGGDPPARLFAFFDPLNVEDKMHARLVAAVSPGVAPVTMWAAGHNTVGPFAHGAGEHLADALRLARGDDGAGLARLTARALHAWPRRPFETARAAAARHPAGAECVLRRATERLTADERLRVAAALAAGHAAKGAHAAARDVLRRFADAEPREAQAAIDVNRAWRQLGDWPQAARWSRRWCDLAPNDRRAHDRYAQDLARVGIP
jgi:hypothetical protein